MFDDINTNFMALENSMSTGKGFGFGAHFRAGFKFDYFVYGEFAIGAGADILLRNYGEATCKGGNGQIGINGWYASGQAYAFLKGDVGIRVKVFGKKRGFSIAKLSAAVLLQAKAPNPAWFRGMVGVKYSVLGGLVKGSANIKVELGTQCEIVGSKELSIQVISDIKPDDKTTGVSVFATPQVAFNMPVEKPFEMLNEQDEVATYRIKLDELALNDDKKQRINGTVETDKEGMSATLKLRDILPPTTRLVASVKIHIERKDGGNWTALKSGSVIDYETRAADFTTGEAPDYIPWENVAYAYPVKYQYNFLPQEYPNGYIKLKRGQPYLFALTDGQGKKWKTSASFAPVTGQPVSTELNYNDAQAQINFSIPSSLAAETIYSFSIKRTSADGESAANNLTTKTETVTEEGNTTTITQTTLKGTAVSGIEKELIATGFRTSLYKTFRQKMEAVSATRDVFDVTTNYMMVIGQHMDMRETFDNFELYGSSAFATQKMIVLKAGKESSWLKNKIMPLLYNDYPFAGITFDNTYQEYRDGTAPAPVYAVTLYNNTGSNTAYQLDDAALKEGQAITRAGTSRFMYYLGFVANKDYHDLLNKAARAYTYGNAGSAVARIISTPFPDLATNQYYPVQFQYRLPGTNYITSTIEKTIFFK